MKQISFLLPLFSLLFVACGEDGTTENVTNINQMGMEVLASVDDLPKCEKSDEGEQALVKGESSVRVCVDGKWFATKESAKDTVVVAGDTVYMNGGDFSCKTEELKDGSGLKIVCNGDSIGVVKNGAAGKNGEDGQSGSSADGCEITQLGATMSITCNGATMRFLMDEDGNVSVDTTALDSEKVAVSLDEVSGASQKGPYLSGSKVLVRELRDGRSLAQTGNNFNGKILNDKGEFKINAQTLTSQYVTLEATGYYRNEVTGENSSSELTLLAITNVLKSKVANINLLTHLEFERVSYLVTKMKYSVAKAKAQAQREVFDLFGIDATGFSSSEYLNIAGASDEDGALLAFSVLLQGDRSVSQLSELLTKIAADMETDGTWDDAKTRMAIAEWAADADSSNFLETIRNNVKGWNLSTVVPNFEQYVRNFWYKEYGLDSCNAKNKDMVKAATGGKRKGTKTRYICKADGAGLLRWQIASDLEKDTYQWKNATDGALKNGDVTGMAYVFDSTGSFNGKAGWREAESIEQQYGGCRKALYDSIRTDNVYAYYYTCKKSTHTWIREVDYLLIDTQYWPDSTDGKVKWGDSIGIATPGTRICYVWDDAPQYNGWRTGNADDCNLGLLGCTAKRSGEMRKTANSRFYSCSNNKWTEILNEVYINTYLYRCTIDGEGENVYKDGDMVYGMEYQTTRYACENEQWRETMPGEEQVGLACTANNQGRMSLDSTRTCDNHNWRASIPFDFPVDKDWINPDLTYGELKDNRDGRIYKTIEINGITVMAQNLVYGDSVKNPYLKNQSWCYKNDTLNCVKGGRYYSWTAAMDIHSKWLRDSPNAVEGLIGNPHQGICPEGWHIPTTAEWTALFKNISYAAQQALGYLDWKNATNARGFSALPVGYYSNGGYANDASKIFFWSATEGGLGNSHSWSLTGSGAGINQSMAKWSGFSVRCVQDSPVAP